MVHIPAVRTELTRGEIHLRFIQILDALNKDELRYIYTLTLLKEGNNKITHRWFYHLSINILLV